MESDIFRYYGVQSAYTNQDGYNELFSDAGGGPEEIFRFLKRVVIHPVDAKATGVRANMKEAMRLHAFTRTIADLMKHPKIAALIDARRFGADTEPKERAILSCDHAALLYTSILRERNIPVRMRVGFAKYIVPNQHLPHWICEENRNEKSGWRQVDPERGLLSIERDGFIPAGALWFAARSGAFDPSGLCVGNFRSYDAIKYELLNDLNCMMKHELVNYDWMISGSPKKPGLFRMSVDKLSEDDLELLDRLAVVSAGNSFDLKAIAELYGQYISPENLRS